MEGFKQSGKIIRLDNSQKIIQNTFFCFPLYTSTPVIFVNAQVTVQVFRLFSQRSELPVSSITFGLLIHLVLLISTALHSVASFFTLSSVAIYLTHFSDFSLVSSRSRNVVVKIMQLIKETYIVLSCGLFFLANTNEIKISDNLSTYYI